MIPAWQKASNAIKEALNAFLAHHRGDHASFALRASPTTLA
jgi:hypothetical protein